MSLKTTGTVGATLVAAATAALLVATVSAAPANADARSTSVGTITLKATTASTSSTDFDLTLGPGVTAKQDGETVEFTDPAGHEGILPTSYDTGSGTVTGTWHLAGSQLQFQHGGPTTRSYASCVNKGVRAGAITGAITGGAAGVETGVFPGAAAGFIGGGLIGLIGSSLNC